jgi:hypothetical protein
MEGPFEITRQAYIAGVALLLSFLAQLLIIIFFIKEAGIIEYLLFIVYIILMVPFIVYATSCLTTGKCVVLSWSVAIFYILVALSNTILLTTMLLTKKFKKNI